MPSSYCRPFDQLDRRHLGISTANYWRAAVPCSGCWIGNQMLNIGDQSSEASCRKSVLLKEFWNHIRDHMVGIRENQMWDIKHLYSFESVSVTICRLLTLEPMLRHTALVRNKMWPSVAGLLELYACGLLIYCHCSTQSNREHTSSLRRKRVMW